MALRGVWDHSDIGQEEARKEGREQSQQPWFRSPKESVGLDPLAAWGCSSSYHTKSDIPKKRGLKIGLEGSSVGMDGEGASKLQLRAKASSLSDLHHSLPRTQMFSEKKVCVLSAPGAEAPRDNLEASRTHFSSSSWNMFVFDNLRWELLEAKRMNLTIFLVGLGSCGVL